jgi:hypothetical protein
MFDQLMSAGGGFSKNCNRRFAPLARCPSTLGVCEPLVAVQSRQPLQLLEVNRPQVDHRHQLCTNRADSQQFQLRLRHLGGGHPLFFAGVITRQRAADGVGLR